MTMKTLETLCAGGTWKGPVPEALVKSYEAVLGVAFPSAYRSFLLTCGSGHKNGVELAGIDPVLASDFNVIGRSVLQRRQYRYFPQDGLYISDTGDGGQICLDPKSGEVLEVFAEPPRGVSSRVIATNFLDFLSLRF